MIEPASWEIHQTGMAEILVLITQVHSVKQMIVLRLIASIPNIDMVCRMKAWLIQEKSFPTQIISKFPYIQRQTSSSSNIEVSNSFAKCNDECLGTVLTVNKHLGWINICSLINDINTKALRLHPTQSSSRINPHGEAKGDAFRRYSQSFRLPRILCSSGG